MAQTCYLQPRGKYNNVTITKRGFNYGLAFVQLTNWLVHAQGSLLQFFFFFSFFYFLLKIIDVYTSLMAFD